MRQFVDLVYRRLRLRNPWNYKAPLLISLPYFMIAVGRVPWDRALLGILAALCTIAGIAGAAYFINDLGDARSDLLAADTKFKKTTDSAPNTESGDGCAKPEVASEVLSLILR